MSGLRGWLNGWGVLRLVLLSLLLAGCKVNQFTLTEVTGSGDEGRSIAVNQVDRIYFRFESTEDPVERFDDTVILVQLPEHWRVLAGFLGRSDFRYELMPRLDPLPSGTPAAEAGMQVVGFRNTYDGYRNGGSPNAGFVTFVSDGVTAAAGGVKAVYGREVDGGFVAISPADAASFAEVAGPTGSSPADLIHSGEVLSDPAPEVWFSETPERVLWQEYEGPFSTWVQFKVAPVGSEAAANHSAYRLFIAKVPGGAGGAVSLPASGHSSLSYYEQQDPPLAFVNLCVEEASLGDGVYFVDVPVMPGSPLRVSLSCLGNDTEYVVGAVALTADESDAANQTTDYDFSASLSATAGLVDAHDLSGALLPGDTGLTDLSGVRLTFRSRSDLDQFSRQAAVSSNGAGGFVYDVTLESGVYELAWSDPAYAGGHELSLEPRRITVDADGTIDLRLTGWDAPYFSHEASATFTGVIRNPDGPVPGIPVAAASEQHHSPWVFTDAEGRYTLDVKPGAGYVVRMGGGYWEPVSGDYVFPPALADEVYYTDQGGAIADRSQATTVTAVDGAVTTLNPVLLPAFHEISGVVTDHSGAAVGGLWVSVRDRTTGDGGSARTDDQGRYGIGVPAGADYTVQVGGCASRDDTGACLADYPYLYYDGDAAGLGVFDVGDATTYTRGTLLHEAATLLAVDDGTPALSGINFRYPAIRGVSGVAYLGDAPAEEYWVSVYSEVTRGGGWSRVGADGRFTVDGVVAGDGYRVWLYPDGVHYDGPASGMGVYDAGDASTYTAGDDSWNTATLLDLSTADVAGVNFRLPGVDELGEVAGDITVPSAVTRERRLYYSLILSSETAGVSRNTLGYLEPGETHQAYRFERLAPADDYRLEIWADTTPGGFYAGSGDGVSDALDSDESRATSLSVRAGETLSGIDLVLDGGRRISGTLSVENLPAECDHANDGRGCSVYVAAHSATGIDRSEWYYVTRSSGVLDYAIGGLSSTAGYTLRIAAWEAGLRARYYAGAADGEGGARTLPDQRQATSLDLSAGDASSIDLILGDGHVLSGTVTLNGVAPGTGQRVWIGLYSPSTFAFADASLWIPPGESSAGYRIVVTPASDYSMHVSADDWIVHSTTGELAGLGAGDVAYDIVLDDGIVISGTISDGSGGVSGAWIQLLDEQGGYVASSWSAGGGSYALRGIPAGRYLLRVWVSGYGVVEASTGDVSADTTVDVSVDGGASISGIVVDPLGRPVPYAWVSAEGGGRIVGVDTGLDGRFVIHRLLDDTEYRVTAWNTIFNEVSTTVTVSGGSADAGEIRFTGGNRVFGTVTGVGDWGAVTGSVSVFNDDGAGSPGVLADDDSFEQSLAIHWDGSFATPVMADGEYWFKPEVPGYRGDAVAVTMAGAAVEGVTVSVSAVVGNENDIVGQVVDDVDALSGIASIEVVAVDGTGEVVASDTVSAVGGTFALGGLLPESHTVYVYAYDAAGAIIGVASDVERAVAGAVVGAADLGDDDGNSGALELEAP